MAVETSAVQITINVVDGNSGAVVSKVSQNLQQLGAAGSTSGQRVKQGMDAAGAGSLSAVEKTRLATEEFGVRLPRAMVKLVSQSKIAQAALSAVGTGLIALGSIQIGAMIFEQLSAGAQKLWHNVLDVNGALKDYNAEIAKAKTEDFGNPTSIATTRMRIDEATAAVKAYQAEADRLHEKSRSGVNILDPIGAIGYSWWAHDARANAVNSQRQVDTLQKERLPEMQHQSNVSQIELEHAGDARLRGEAKITAEKQKQLELDREEGRYQTQKEGKYGNPVATNSLWSTGHLSDSQVKDQIAIARAEADTFNLEREHSQELAHMRAEAVQADLRGTALRKAQEAEAIDELRFKDMDSIAARKAIHDKFHGEELKHLQDENREIQKMRETTQISGLTGVARVRQEQTNRINDVYNDPNSTMNPGQRLAAVNEIHKQTVQQIDELNKSFADRVNEVVGQNAAHELTGFARIRQEAENQTRQFEQEFQKNGGRPEDLARVKTSIAQNANYQETDLTRKNTEETEQIEAEARAKSMTAVKQQSQAIEAEYEERLRKFNDQLKQQEISQNDYDRRVAAAAEVRDAEMVEASKAAREKMAGEFSGFFKSLDHPTEAFKNLGDKVAGQAAAAMVQRLQNHFGGAGTGTSSPISGGMDHVWSRIAGTPNGTARGLHGTTATSASKVMSLAMAEIRIQNANVAFGATTGTGTASAPGGSGTYASGSGAPSGSTTATGEFGGSTAGASGYGGSSSTLGGAGSVASGGASNSFTAGSAGAVPASSNRTGAAVGEAQQGLGLAKQAKSIFGGGSGKSDAGSGLAETQGQTIVGQFDKNGNFVAGGSTNPNGGMLGGGGIKSNAMGAAGGALGLFSAYEGNGGVGGALSGAMSGMQLGMSLGGPMGAAIGLGAGALLGAIGFGGREKARVYDLKTVRPRIANDQDSYQQGGMDYLSAYSDIESLQQEAARATNQMGPAAQSYYQDTIKKEIKEAEGKLTAQQRAGRSMYTAQAAQYDWGGPVDNFGSLSDGPDHGYARLQRNEFVVEQQAAQTHGGALNAINSGATHADMAKYYGADSSTMPAASTPAGWTGDMHVHTIDAKGVAQFLDKYKHNIRSAVNDSMGENSGGGLA